MVSPLPGIWPSLHLDTAITLPVGVEAYAAYALRAWLTPRSGELSARTAPVCQWSAICSFTPRHGWAGRLPPDGPGRVTGIAQKTGFGMVSPLPGIWPSLHLDTAITLPVGVEAYAAYALRAWLARDQSISGRTRRFAKWSAICSFALGMAGQVAYHLMARPGGAGAVGGHHHRVLPAGPGPGHGDRAGAHATRRRRGRGHAGQPDRTTNDPAVPVPNPTRTGRDQATGCMRRPGPVRLAGPGRSRPRTAASRWGQGIRSQACTATDGPGSRGWQEACCVGEASITACVAQRRSQRLQRSPERASAYDQRRTCRSVRSARNSP